MTEAHLEAYRATRTVTLTALVVNIGLSILKLAGGLWSGSVALFADAANSLSDIGIDAAILAAAKLSARPVDHNHRYGHGKFETVTAVNVALVIIAVGLGFAWHAYRVISEGPSDVPGFAMIAIASVTLVSKEWIYRRTKSVASRFPSQTLNANAWNHRSDALAAFVVLAGGLGAALGWPIADPIAALFVSALIVFAGGRVLFDCLRELTDAAAEPEICERVERIIHDHPRVRAHHELRSRRVGRDVHIDVHVLVDPSLNVFESHAITKELKDAMVGVSPFIDLLVHVEPDVPEQRTGHEYVPGD